MLSILDYRLSEERRYLKSSFVLLVVIFFIVLGFIVVNKNFYYYSYYNNIGVLKDNSLSCLVDVNDLEKITLHNTLIVNNNKFAYTINNIGEEIINGDNALYKEVMLHVDFDEKLDIPNNYFDFKIVTNKMTIFRYIVKMLKGE